MVLDQKERRKMYRRTVWPMNVALL